MNLTNGISLPARLHDGAGVSSRGFTVQETTKYAKHTKCGAVAVTGTPRMSASNSGGATLFPVSRQRLRSFRVFRGLLALAGWLMAGLATAQEPHFLTHIRQLTYEGKRSGEGYFSPDGKKLIFQSERAADNPFYQIFILDLESGDSLRVSPGVGKTTCAFFRPGADQVLFASTHHDPDARGKQKAELELRASGKERRYAWDYDETMDLFSVRQDGRPLKQLTSTRGYDAEGAYSPDGRKIVFCSLRDAYPPEKLSTEDRKRLGTDPAYFGEIYLMNADGSDQRRLTRTPGYDGGPFFSPDGKRIIWRRFSPDGATADIYTMKLDGGDVRRLTDFGAMSWAPYFHPSGKYVIFTANKLGFSNFELYLVDPEGTREPVRVTYTDGFDGLPVFSPDGKKLAWTSNRYAANPTSTDKGQLFLADWNDRRALAELAAAPPRKTPAVAAKPVSAHVSKPAPVVAAAAPPRRLHSEITPDDLRATVAYLASDALEGRLTGSSGSRQAEEFIAQTLQRAGLVPLGDRGSFFQDFEFNAGVKVVTNENQLAIFRSTGEDAPRAFRAERDFRPLAFTDNGTVEGEVVFAGYGLRKPGSGGEGYDSYAGVDATNKIVLVLRYVPEGVDAKRRAELNVYAGLRYKALVAREHGARAILVVTGPNSPNAGELAPLSFDNTLSGSGIVAMTINGSVADALLAGSGKDLKTLQSGLDTENPHAESGFLLPRVKVKLNAAVQPIKKSDRNVIAGLPPARKSAPPSGAQYVMLGAHGDHLGRGEAGGGMGIKGDEGQIHNGADDNASGVAVLLELAAALAKEKQQKPELFSRGIIFSFWSGEELGLIGSSYFAEHPTVPLSNVVAYLNFDMVGRLRENRLILQGVGSSPVWKGLIEKRNIPAGFNLVLQDDPFLPTDTTALYPKHVPVLAFFTGSHEQYHRPTDDTDTLNYEGMERIARFTRSIVLDLVKAEARPEYVRVERSASGGGRDTLRAYLGTVPDYATEVKGVKLSGVRANSPADKGGLKGGDIIIEFAGQKVNNIYDYTYALDAVKIGQPVKIVVTRDGKRAELSVIPEARK